ncbi:antA/AntB antirepressor family protein [Turicibacter sanguinis]|uniref:antA/AntB antirepressor family protein n=1 Tax=Turicibacter sanguinis TaxID=154288 RepID=UPI0018AA9ACB|nr:antA/AntB antirepressor family protein [Turicibacter sanguinis]MDB8564559.1 antA/AntB antirepressor family protein [Turicibacter sanguinis]
MEINIKSMYSRGYEESTLELIKIDTNEDGEKVVSARELYLGLGLDKSQWARWFKKNIEQNEYFKLGVDWVGFDTMSNGNLTKDFAISLDFAKHIAMMARTEMSHKYRNYFIECEKAAHNPYSHLSKEFQALIMHDEKIMKLERRVEDIEDNAYLSPSEYGMVGQKVNNKIHAIVTERGLKLSRQQRSELYKSLNRDIKTITGVHHRCQLRRKHLDQVLEFIYRWEPSLATMMKVEQMDLFNTIN